MRAALALCAALAVVSVGPRASLAQQDAPAATDPVAGPAAEPGAADAGAVRKGRGGWGDGRAVLDPRKSPARGEPYAWRQMLMGGAIMLAMLAFVVWLIRRSKRR